MRFRDMVPAGVKFDVEDSGFAFIRFEDGLIMHLEVTWSANVTDAVPVSPWAGHELENTTLYGERATLSLNPAKIYTMEGMQRVETQFEPTGNANQFELQMDNFLGSIRTGAAPINNADQAVGLMKMLMAIYESSATRAGVRLWAWFHYIHVPRSAATQKRGWAYERSTPPLKSLPKTVRVTAVAADAQPCLENAYTMPRHRR